MKQALEEIRHSIPPYAPWQYDKLDQAFNQYLVILNALRSAGGFESALSMLHENATLIRTLIDDARSSASPLAYDRAAMELTWDLDSLIRMLG